MAEHMSITFEAADGVVVMVEVTPTLTTFTGDAGEVIVFEECITDLSRIEHIANNLSYSYGWMLSNREDQSVPCVTVANKFRRNHLFIEYLTTDLFRGRNIVVTKIDGNDRDDAHEDALLVEENGKKIALFDLLARDFC